MNSMPAPNAEDDALLGSAETKPAMMKRAVERLAASDRRSTAEMLSELRRAFPDSPLAVRVRALEALRRR